jgi:hypothetical protein
MEPSATTLLAGDPVSDLAYFVPLASMAKTSSHAIKEFRLLDCYRGR